MTDNTSDATSWELAEYSSAMEAYRHYTDLRRQDLTFVTTVQIAVLTIVGAKLATMDLASWLLSIVAVFVLLLGINSERRLGAYLVGYKNRASKIEKEHHMHLIQYGEDEVRGRKLQISNRVVFPIYYFVFLLVWITVWVTNIM